ncbi:MAG: aminopeptidase P family protein [Candidatus Omnitrophica bacterium]|nr:aminopeptidase P family protein [Candidatus Omnitrophota bacterium]
MNTRIKAFHQTFEKYRLDAFLVTEESNVTYLSGYTGTESYLLITPKEKYFLTDFRYLEQAEKELTGFEIVLRTNQSYPAMIYELCRKAGVMRMGFESNRISYQLYSMLSRTLKNIFPVPVPNSIEGLRICKSADEIKQLKSSATIAMQGVRFLQAQLEPGQKEIDIQAKLEYDTKLLGSEKPAFDMIVAAGPGSSMPHAISGQRKVLQNDMVLVDMGVTYKGYRSDLTRCFFIGKIPRLKKKVYDIVKKAQALGIQKAKPGVRIGDVDVACRSFIEKAGYGKYFGHSTGHGVGLEVHEAPGVYAKNDDILKPGMIITVEPGIYLPDQFGVRIEDMVRITSSGNEVLTGDLEK